VTWAGTRDDLRGVLLVGSYARQEVPADEFSDVDFILICEDPASYVEDERWPDALGVVWMTFMEPTAGGEEMERRVLFEDGLDADFALLSAEFVRRVGEAGVPDDFADVLRRGMKILIDKDGLLESLHIPPVASPTPPTEGVFREVVVDFWYHAVWTAKRVARGELWRAIECCDGYMKRRLIRMMAWHVGATRGWETDTWFGGRFLERWGNPTVLRAMRTAFAQYEADDIGRALRATMDLFGGLAVDVARLLGYAYPSDIEQRARMLVDHGPSLTHVQMALLTNVALVSIVVWRRNARRGLV
jgi:aminoglycoside 6-adenylyltransferase